jgi:hypothetical protein
VSSFYTELRATANDLLLEFGRAMTISDEAAGTYQPGTGIAPKAPASFACTGAMFDYDGLEFDGSAVIRGDRRIYISAESITKAPKVGMRVTVGAELWHVVNTKTIDPGGIDVLYDVQVRR